MNCKYAICMLCYSHCSFDVDTRLFHLASCWSSTVEDCLDVEVTALNVPAAENSRLCYATCDCNIFA